MRKLIAGSAATVGVTAALMAISGTGVAAADSYAGQVYADASKALSGANLKGVVASRVGDALPLDQCVVTSSEKAPWIKGGHFKNVSDTVLLSLNCNATVASATKPGNSAASPEGRAAMAAASAAEAKKQAAATKQNGSKH